MTLRIHFSFPVHISAMHRCERGTRNNIKSSINSSATYLGREARHLLLYAFLQKKNITSNGDVMSSPSDKTFHGWIIQHARVYQVSGARQTAGFHAPERTDGRINELESSGRRQWTQKLLREFFVLPVGQKQRNKLKMHQLDRLLFFHLETKADFPSFRNRRFGAH